jgi:hypothetical protein
LPEDDLRRFLGRRGLHLQNQDEVLLTGLRQIFSLLSPAQQRAFLMDLQAAASAGHEYSGRS